ncbi:hypothetical protein ACP26C_00420 [Franconibacter helveticus 513]|uniref:hypothetical protein n=1 Tax=Franconibacter helveticus TaxID=357240 RepID=UPI00040841DE
MINFIRKWLKEELILFLWGWGVVLSVIAFSMFVVSFFPDYAINLTGLFILLVVGLHLFLWFKFK